jgi:hypothetical protein
MSRCDVIDAMRQAGDELGVETNAYDLLANKIEQNEQLFSSGVTTDALLALQNELEGDTDYNDGILDFSCSVADGYTYTASGAEPSLTQHFEFPLSTKNTILAAQEIEEVQQATTQARQDLLEQMGGDDIPDRYRIVDDQHKSFTTYKMPIKNGQPDFKKVENILQAQVDTERTVQIEYFYNTSQGVLTQYEYRWQSPTGEVDRVTNALGIPRGELFFYVDSENLGDGNIRIQ